MLPPFVTSSMLLLLTLAACADAVKNLKKEGRCTTSLTLMQCTVWMIKFHASRAESIYDDDELPPGCSVTSDEVNHAQDRWQTVSINRNPQPDPSKECSLDRVCICSPLPQIPPGGSCGDYSAGYCAPGTICLAKEGRACTTDAGCDCRSTCAVRNCTGEAYVKAASSKVCQGITCTQQECCPCAEDHVYKDGTCKPTCAVRNCTGEAYVKAAGSKVCQDKTCTQQECCPCAEDHGYKDGTCKQPDLQYLAFLLSASVLCIGVAFYCSRLPRNALHGPP